MPSRQPGSECCVSRRRRRPRSVHSGCVGCVIEPRNGYVAGAETVQRVERNMDRAAKRGHARLPGSKSRSRAKGSRRNLGDPAFGQSNSASGPHREGRTESPMMNERGKSAPAIVATKLANKAERSVAEPVEPRAGTKGNANQQHSGRTPSRETVSQVLVRIRQTARERKKERFTALFHHINVELLRDAFFAIRREAAPGVDGVTWQDYAANVETNLHDLYARVQRGAYRALPSRRQYIP